MLRKLLNDVISSIYTLMNLVAVQIAFLELISIRCSWGAKPNMLLGPIRLDLLWEENG